MQQLKRVEQELLTPTRLFAELRITRPLIYLVCLFFQQKIINRFFK